MHSQLMFAIAILLLALGITQMMGQDASRQPERAAVEGENFLTYKDAVREYIQNNPGYDGSINESALDLPGTYQNLGWSSEAESGEAWIYGDMPPGGLREAVESTGQAINLGRKEGGMLVSPVYGDTGISVPGFVSEGQAAAVVKNT